MISAHMSKCLRDITEQVPGSGSSSGESSAKSNHASASAKASMKVYLDLVHIFLQQLSPNNVFPELTLNDGAVIGGGGSTSSNTNNTAFKKELPSSTSTSSASSHGARSPSPSTCNTVEECVTAHKEILEKHCNYRLAYHCIQAVVVHAILLLPETYSCLSPEDAVGVLSTGWKTPNKQLAMLDIMMSLVAEKRLHMRIEMNSLVFQAPTERHYTSEECKQVQMYIQENIEYSRQLALTKKNVLTTVDYLYQHNKKYSGGSGSGGGGYGSGGYPGGGGLSITGMDEMDY